jgi:uridine kinase
MIIWINGAFGSGKTQTSYELHRRITNSYVYDPENIGFFIRRNIPKEAHKGDFQNYAVWREFNYSMLKYMDQEYDGIIIVPMTIVNPQYFNEIIALFALIG